MTTALATIAVLLSAAALFVSIWTALIGRRNVVAAEESAVSARFSAEAAKDSAKHAEKSAESAGVVAQAEVGRDHRELRPLPPEKGSAIRRRDNARTGNRNRFLVFRPERTYRVAGDALIGDSRRPLSVGPLIEGGKEVEIFLDEGLGSVQVDAVNIRFWPSIPGDPGEDSHCQCGRNTDPSGQAHWEWTIEIPKARPAVVV
jgi:hypothetical protein